MWSNSRHIYKDTEFEAFHWVSALARFSSAWSGQENKVPDFDSHSLLFAPTCFFDLLCNNNKIPVT